MYVQSSINSMVLECFIGTSMDKRFKDQTVICVASGPSLTDEQIRIAEESEHPIIVVNDNFKKVILPDIIFATDIVWWCNNYLDVIDTIDPKYTELWTIKDIGQNFKKKRPHQYSIPINEVGYFQQSGLGLTKVHHGGNSGYIAINLAYLFGAKKIILIGYDHQHTYGKAHWFGDHDKTKYRRNAEDTDHWIKNFSCLAKDLKINSIDLTNCSIETSLTSCRRSSIESEV